MFWLLLVLLPTYHYCRLYNVLLITYLYLIFNKLISPYSSLEVMTFEIGCDFCRAFWPCWVILMFLVMSRVCAHLLWIGYLARVVKLLKRSLQLNIIATCLKPYMVQSLWWVFSAHWQVTGEILKKTRSNKTSGIF